MTLRFNPEGRRLALTKYDRVTIHDIEWRPCYKNDIGHVMLRVDGTGVAEEFTHKQLGRLASEGKLRHEPNYFLAENAVRRLHHSEKTMTSRLSVPARVRMSRREAFVLAFYDLWHTKRIKRSDASIDANMGVMTENLCSESGLHHQEVTRRLERLGVTAVVDPEEIGTRVYRREDLPEGWAA